MSICGVKGEQKASEFNQLYPAQIAHAYKFSFRSAGIALFTQTTKMEKEEKLCLVDIYKIQMSCFIIRYSFLQFYHLL